MFHVESPCLAVQPFCLMPQEGHAGDGELRHAGSAAAHRGREDAATEVGDVLDVHLASVDGAIRLCMYIYIYI